MTTKHTPGPWKYVFLREDSIISIQEVRPLTEEEMDRGDDPSICGIHGVSGISDLDKANARLIAAAPELLEALKRVACACDTASCVLSHGKSDYDKEEAQRFRNDYKLCIDAISKAEGQSL